uniref:Uncharacterized protein n=1 Tax=Pipistrellus kuhlii TaxID=59472 RepID=A0A7J7YWR5_PIPKU|nr:hypothetical protein mPipKuh1_009867 [Pipistrellus kuhlii]
MVSAPHSDWLSSCYGHSMIMVNFHIIHLFYRITLVPNNRQTCKLTIPQLHPQPIRVSMQINPTKMEFNLHTRHPAVWSRELYQHPGHSEVGPPWVLSNLGRARARELLGRAEPGNQEELQVPCPGPKPSQRLEA